VSSKACRTLKVHVPIEDVSLRRGQFKHRSTADAKVTVEIATRLRDSVKSSCWVPDEVVTGKSAIRGAGEIVYYRFFPQITHVFQLKDSTLRIRSAPLGSAEQIALWAEEQPSSRLCQVVRVCAETVENLLPPLASGREEFKHGAEIHRSSEKRYPIEIA